MKWKYHDATLWKLIRRRTGLSLPFTRANDGEGQIEALTPIESKHKSRDTVTGFAWVRDRRRSSVGTRKSRRMRRFASNKSLSSQRNTPFAGPSPPLRLRQSRSSDFRQSSQVILLPPLTNPPSHPISPVWGMDGVIDVNEVPRSSSLPPSPIYGLDGIMEAHTSTRPPPSHIAISFTQPRPLDQVIHEAQTNVPSEEVTAPKTDNHPEEDDRPSSSGEPPAAHPQLPTRRTILSLSKKRRRKAKPTQHERFGYASTQGDEPPTIPDTPNHSMKDDSPQEDDGADQEPEAAFPSEQLPPIEPPQARPEGDQTTEASPRSSSRHSSNESRAVSSREANETSLRITDWLQEVAQAASHRGSSCSPSASFASREDYANTRSSTNRHRRSPANHSPPPSPTPTSPIGPSSSETQVADVDGSHDVTFLKFQPEDDYDVGSRASCEAQVDFSSVEHDEQLTPLTSSLSARVVRSSSGSSERTLHSSPTIFDESGDHYKRSSTSTSSTSRGTPSPILPTPPPWDLDPTKSTITRVGDIWSAGYLASRGHGRQKHTKELEWKKHWRRHGEKDSESTGRGTTTKIYWTNYHIPTTHDSHWQPPPGFRP